MYTYTYTYIYTYIYTYTYVHIHICIHICTHTYTYIHMCTHMSVPNGPEGPEVTKRTVDPGTRRPGIGKLRILLGEGGRSKRGFKGGAGCCGSC